MALRRPSMQGAKLLLHKAEGASLSLRGIQQNLLIPTSQSHEIQLHPCVVQQNRELSTRIFKRGGGNSKLNRNRLDRSASRSEFKLRTHAINVFDGNYDDYDEDDDDLFEEAFPVSDAEDKWDIASFNDMNKNTKGTNIDTAFMEDEMAQRVLAEQQAEDEQKARWIENAKPKIRVQEIDAKTGRSYGKGGRKTSTARVWIQPGEGVVTVNRREFLDYFPRGSLREMILAPFVATETCGKFDVITSVEGGGLSGQAGAIRHGIARALEKYNPDYRPPMKRLGYMKRDPRMVERKKIGLKKARKAPQWVRR